MEPATGLNELPRCQEGVLAWRLGDLPEGWRYEKGTAKPRRASPSLKGGFQNKRSVFREEGTRSPFENPILGRVVLAGQGSDWSCFS